MTWHTGIYLYSERAVKRSETRRLSVFMCNFQVEKLEKLRYM